MKKIIAAVMSVLMLSCLAGCAKKDSAEPETPLTSAVTTEAETTKASEPIITEKKKEETTAAKTEAETTAAAETEASAEETTQAAAETAAAEEADPDSNLTEAIMKKIASWDKGNVIIEASVTEDGNSVEIYMNRCGNKNILYMNIIGMFATKTIFDGTNTYLVSDTKKNYCRSTSSSDDDNPLDDFMIDSSEALKISDKGKETVEGKEYFYEEFEEDGEKIRYYFDSKGDLCYVGGYTDGKLQIMNFRTTFLDAPDESVFKVPDGYAEITEDEMAMQMFAEMFGSLGELMAEESANS